MKKLCMGLLVLLSAEVAAVDVQFHPAARPGAPFSEAVRVGDLIFLAGRLGIVKGKLAEGGIQAETRAAMESIKTSVEKYGSSMDRVVKCTVFMADMKEWPKMNEVYTTFFKNNLPARSAFGVNGLALGARVEIECIAAAGS